MVIFFVLVSRRPKMNALNDNTLLTIFKQLRLDQRASLRLVSKRFKLLCDSIEINKLVVYHQNEPRAGKLQFIEQEYGLQDTVYVYNLQQFFDNEQIVRHQMRRIEVLVLNGEGYTLASRAKIGHQFAQLNYLELSRVEIAAPKMLKSKNIKHLILLNGSCMNFDAFSTRCDLFELSGLNSLASKVKCFSTDLEVDSTFVSRCVQSRMFDSMEELELRTRLLDDLVGLGNRYPSLKVLRWFNPNLHKALPSLDKELLQFTAMSLRTGLSLYVYGIRLDKQSASFISAFLREVSNYVRMVDNENKLELQIDSEVYKFLSSSIRKHPPLAGFFDEIICIWIRGEVPMTSQLFGHFHNCIVVHFNGKTNIAKFLDLCSDLQTLHLSERCEQAVLDSMPEKASNLEYLAITDFDKPSAKFDFVFGFSRLRMLTLCLLQPIAREMFLGLIKELKHLVLADVRFVRSNGEPSTKSLSEFKRQVNQALEKKPTKTVFKIEIHSKDDCQFIRYVLNTNDKARPMMEIEKQVFFQFAKFIQTRS